MGGPGLPSTSDREDEDVNEELLEEMAGHSAAADRARDREQRVHATIAPRPELNYPAPWYIGETLGNEHVIVVCSEGHYTCEAASMAAAEAIVLAVNTLAGVETR